MASEETSEPVSLSLPDDLSAWVRRRADERGVDAETYARELLAAQRAVDVGEVDALPDATDSDLDERLESVREEFTDLLEDVRSRVVQVKRETDAKAPADHEHTELAADLERLESAIDDVAADVEAHETAVSELEEDLERGFDNYEEVLEYLVDATDDLSDRVDRLARATLSTRERVEELAPAAHDRERLADLKRDAALSGVASAACDACGHDLDPALLVEPRCPACEATFVDVEPKRGFLGSATFVTGDPPELAAGDGDDLAAEVESVLEEDGPRPGEVDWASGGDDE